MKTNLRKRLLNSIGVAVVAMLLGSNVGYALDNYEILTHNLSHAGIASTGGTGGTEGIWGGNDKLLSIETEASNGVGWGTDEKGTWVFSEEKCKGGSYQLNAVEAWVFREATVKFESKDGAWEVRLFGETVKSGPAVEEGKVAVVTYTYKSPICYGEAVSCCCALSHKEKPGQNLGSSFYIKNL